MNGPKDQRRRLSLEYTRRALESLTPAGARALRRRFGLDRPLNAVEDDEALRSLVRELSAQKKRSKR
jgi:hypothetical protein